MSSSTLTGALDHVVFRFTRGRTEHYNPNKPGFTEKSFGYDPIESKGPSYQQYRDTEATSLDYLASRNLHIRVTKKERNE